MTDPAFATTVGPDVMIAASVGAMTLATMTLGLLGWVILAARRRLDVIEATQAEVAALIAIEARRTQGMFAKKLPTGPELRRRAATQQASSKPYTAARLSQRIGEKVQLPLRKTVH